MRFLCPAKILLHEKAASYLYRFSFEKLSNQLKNAFFIALCGWSTALVDIPPLERSIEIPVLDAEPKNPGKKILSDILASRDYSIDIGRDRSLFLALKTAGIPANIVEEIERCIPRKIARSFRPGQKVHLGFQNGALSSIRIHTGISVAWAVEKKKSTGRWTCKKVATKLTVRSQRIRLVVKNSLKKAILSADIDRSLKMDMIRSLASSGISWGNLLGTKIEVMYQTLENPQTKACALDRIQLVSVQTKNESPKIYYGYQNKPRGRNVFYTLAGFGSMGGANRVERGCSGRSALWGPPVARMRINSKFGPRVHPISGLLKHHNGADFRGPIGTTIRAVGAGVVKSVQSSSSYGKFIVLRHVGGYTTLYAHLSRVCVRVGQKVSLGQTIGNMGCSGLATGSHLHLEVRHMGKAVDPLKIIGSAQKTTLKRPDTNHRLLLGQKSKFKVHAQNLRNKFLSLGGRLPYHNQTIQTRKIRYQSSNKCILASKKSGKKRRKSCVSKSVFI